MDIAEAIANLRGRLGLSQADFAKKLEITVTSVSRYENGREPNKNVRQRLLGLARDTHAPQHLQDLFQASVRSDIAAKVESLPTDGAARRITVSELRLLKSGLQLIQSGVEAIWNEKNMPEERRVEIMDRIVYTAIQLKEDIVEPYLGSSSRGSQEGGLYNPFGYANAFAGLALGDIAKSSLLRNETEQNAFNRLLSKRKKDQ